MRKVFKVAAIMAVTAMVLAMPVFGQDAFDTFTASPGSPTATATSGIFGTDVDDSIDVLNYGGVEFDKGMAFVGISQAMPSLGFATRFGAMYLGTWYNGRILSYSGNETITLVRDFDIDNQLSTQTTTTTTYTSQMIQGGNRFQALLGIIGMGIKIGFYENLKTYRNPTTSDNTLVVTEDLIDKSATKKGEVIDFSKVEGSIIPSVHWGMSININDNFVIKPTFAMAFDIYQENFILNRKGQSQSSINYYSNGKLTGVSWDGKNLTDGVNYDGSSKDYLGLNFNVGALAGLNDMEFGIDYKLGINVYNNKYDAAGFSGNGGVIERY